MINILVSVESTEEKMLAPIALFCYRRLDVLTKTVEALKNNELASKTDLIIFSDGSKDENDIKDVKEVRKYLKTIDGFKNITIIESNSNKGLATSIISGVTSIVNKYGKVIVIEDDILTSQYFLNYMNDALEMYKNDKEVACISGYTYPIDDIKEQSFFIKSGECWGWATTKDGWSNFEPDGKKLLKELYDKNLTYEFDFNNSYPYMQMLKDQIEGKNNSWAIRWNASLFLKNKLCLHLGKSIVQNIGFGEEGSTHCKERCTVFDVDLNFNKIKLEKISLKESKKIRKKFMKFFNKISQPKISESGNFFLKKIKNGNKRTIKILNFIKISYKK